MKFVKFTLKEGFFKKTVEFSGKTNIVYSKKNSTGKTTLLRAIYYALGYPVPSTKGIQFNQMEFWLKVVNDDKEYNLYRHGPYLSINEDGEQKDYSLPTDFYEIMWTLTGCKNAEVLDNLLGASYLDQEKGWTLLNRGKVIGNISFNIEALVRGLAGKDCSDEIQRLESVKSLLKKYEYMLSFGKYQEEIYDIGEDVGYDTPEETRDLRIATLKVEREPILVELKQIKDILRKNIMFVNYISAFKLAVRSSTGEEIPVTKETLVGFIDNRGFLIARREMLTADLSNVNRKIDLLEKQKNKGNQLFKVQTVIEAFNSAIKKINVDAVATRKIIDQLKKEFQNLQKQIRFMTKQNNNVIGELHKCISAYAMELGIGENYVAPNKDYIFTNGLKSLSGTILHKIVFSFKLAYIKQIKEKTGIVLPIVLDSPSGREVEYNTVEAMLKIVQRDYSDHQLIVASIHDYELRDKNIIELKNKLVSEESVI